MIQFFLEGGTKIFIGGNRETNFGTLSNKWDEFIKSISSGLRKFANMEVETL